MTSDDVSPPIQANPPGHATPVWDDAVRRRFWAKVHCTTMEDDQCWEWQGALSKCGSGCFKVAGRTVYAHRAAWLLSYVPIPAGQYILHMCDNPRC